jgi:hypothetical protein
MADTGLCSRGLEPCRGYTKQRLSLFRCWGVGRSEPPRHVSLRLPLATSGNTEPAGKPMAHSAPPAGRDDCTRRRRGQKVRSLCLFNLMWSRPSFRGVDDAVRLGPGGRDRAAPGTATTQCSPACSRGGRWACTDRKSRGAGRRCCCREPRPCRSGEAAAEQATQSPTAHGGS